MGGEVFIVFKVLLWAFVNCEFTFCTFSKIIFATIKSLHHFKKNNTWVFLRCNQLTTVKRFIRLYSICCHICCLLWLRLCKVGVTSAWELQIHNRQLVLQTWDKQSYGYIPGNKSLKKDANKLHVGKLTFQICLSQVPQIHRKEN